MLLPLSTTICEVVWTTQTELLLNFTTLPLPLTFALNFTTSTTVYEHKTIDDILESIIGSTKTDLEKICPIQVKEQKIS